MNEKEKMKYPGSVWDRLELIYGCRLLNIYGDQQHGLSDLLDDESEWWLEFEDGWWLRPHMQINPPFVSPIFMLTYEVRQSTEPPEALTMRKFVKNPFFLLPVLGMTYLRDLEKVGIEYADEEMRMAFGCRDEHAEKIIAVLRIGYLNTANENMMDGLGMVISEPTEKEKEE